MEFRSQVWCAFGESLKECREAQGMSQALLALELQKFTRVGGQSGIAKMEAGQRLVSVDHLAAFVWILGVGVDQLLPRVVAYDGDSKVNDLLAEKARLDRERVALDHRLNEVERFLARAARYDKARTVPVPKGRADDGQH